jgi:hypothetical protein
VSGGEFVVIHQRDFDVEVDAVQQRARDALALLFDLAWGATAFTLDVAVESARIRIPFSVTIT